MTAGDSEEIDVSFDGPTPVVIVKVADPMPPIVVELAEPPDPVPPVVVEFSELGTVGPQGEPGPPGTPGAPGAPGNNVEFEAALDDHRNDRSPHPVYDDGPSFLLLYMNAKV